MNRKKFIKRSIGLAAGAGLLTAACKKEAGGDASGPAIVSKKKYRWKMVTTWPPNFPILGEGCKLFAKWVEEATDGQLRIRVFGGGELVPALEVFEAVSSGTAQMGSGASYYWAGRSAATQFFSTVPFGLNAQQMNTWLAEGGGMKWWTELYDGFNMVPLNAGNTGVQMGGWFNRKMDTPDDFKGLKMRMPGLGGKVLEKMGGSAVLLAGGEIYTGLERGVIDATEWIGPFHDYHMGFHKIAKYYYYPGWHEPGTTLEMVINKRHFNGLPKSFQAIVRQAAARLSQWTLSAFEAKNAEYLTKIKEEGKVQILPFPEEVLQLLRRKTTEVLEEVAAGDPFAKKVYASYSAFQAKAKVWAQMTEKPYYDWIM